MTLTAQDRARRIKIILFDVDGVLTDGTIWIYSGSGRRGRTAQSPPKWSRPRATAPTTARA